MLSYSGAAEPLKIWSRWRTGHCPVHIGQSGAPIRPLARPRVTREILGRPLPRLTVGSPDSPVNYSRTPLIPSRERQVRLSQPGTPDTVRCTIGHCPVHHRTLSGADFFPLVKPTVGVSEPLAHRTLSGAHRTVRCPLLTVGSATRRARITRPTVGWADCWLTGQSGDL